MFVILGGGGGGSLLAGGWMGGSFLGFLAGFLGWSPLSGAASVILVGGWVIWALSMFVGFVRRSVSGSAVVLGWGDSVAPDESPPVMPHRIRGCQDVSLVIKGFSRIWVA